MAWGHNQAYGGRGSWNRQWNRNKVKKPPKEKKFYECDLCKVRCDTPDQLNIHQSSKKHMKRVKAAEAQAVAPVPKSPGAAKKKTASGAQRQQKFHCELCGVWCDTNTILQVHFNSKKHKKKEKQGPVVNGMWKCDLCNVGCSSQHALASHFSSKKHQRNVFQHEAAKKASEETVKQVEEKAKQLKEAATKAVNAEKLSAKATSNDTCIVIPTKSEDAAAEGEKPTAKDASGAEGKGSSERMKCELCRIICQNQDAYDFHISTNRHKKREQAMKMEFKCTICCVGTNTQLMLNKHLESNKHKMQKERMTQEKWGFQKSPNFKKATDGKRKTKNRRKRKMKDLTGEGDIVESPPEKKEKKDLKNYPKHNRFLNFVCQICDVRCNTQAVLDVHLSSKKHFRKLKFTKDQKMKLFCVPCKFQADSKAMFDDHLRSSQHAEVAGLNYKDFSNGKRKGDFGTEPRKRPKIEEEEWKVCRICGSEAHKFENCPIKENRGWKIDKIERSHLKKSTTIANDRHRDLVVLFTAKSVTQQRLFSHFICCEVEVQRKMLHQSLKLMTDMLQFVPDTHWYEIDYRYGNWLHTPKKSHPHLHILFPEKQFIEFLGAQPANSPIWPQGIENFEEFSVTVPVQKNYDLDRIYCTKKQAWYNNFTIVDNFLLETKLGLEILLKNGCCDGAVGLRVERPVATGGENSEKGHYQFFIRISAEPFVKMSAENKANIATSMKEQGFETFTGKQWKDKKQTTTEGSANFSM